MNNAPIGIFDSGIGGLTVAHAIRECLPNESLIYFGDTEHLPYGEKSAQAIQHFSKGISRFLIEKQCKAIVIACNSASSTAYDEVKAVAAHVPVINVIDPAVNFLKELSAIRVGVIGTKATIQSGVYKKQIELHAAQHQVQQMPTPLLAHMIEEHFFNKAVEQKVIAEYLSAQALQGIQHLVLACTHYPLIQNQIEDFYQGKINIINSAELVAAEVKAKLSTLGLLANHAKPSYQFYVSDYTESFDKTADLFFGEEIGLEEVKLWA